MLYPNSHENKKVFSNNHISQLLLFLSVAVIELGKSPKNYRKRLR